MRPPNLLRRIAALATLSVLAGTALGAELPHHHLGVIIGHAEEENAEGDFESGTVVGVEYVHQFHPRWALGGVFEIESFGNNHKRHAILAMPVSFYARPRWRLYAAAGIEFSEPWKADKAMARLGTSYEFPLGDGWTLAPEVQVDFVQGGTTVYVFALALGFGWH